MSYKQNKRFIPWSLLTLAVVFAVHLASPCPCMGTPSVYPKKVTVNKTDLTNRGYTLFRADSPGTIYAIDMKGNIVNTWKNPKGDKYRLGPTAKPLPNGHLLVEMGYMLERYVVEMDWSGNVVWEYHPPDKSWLANHDFERMPNGDTLILMSEPESLPNITPQPINEERIFEVDPGGNIVWMWRTSEHYDELPISDEGRQMIYNQTSPYNDIDVFHTNSIQYIPKNPSGDADSRFAEGNILVSQRNTNLVFIIDKSSGNIVWNLSEAIGTAGPTIGQHHAKMIPAGVPGAGNILLFDNGGQGGYPPQFRAYSRVLEINPIKKKVIWNYTGQFVLDANGLKMPLSLRSLFSVARGSAQRLPNGNTLITEAEWRRIFEVNNDSQIVWEYIYPNNPTPEYYSNPQLFIYRAYRVNFTWPTGAVGPGKMKRFTW